MGDILQILGLSVSPRWLPQTTDGIYNHLNQLASQVLGGNLEFKPEPPAALCLPFRSVFKVATTH